MVNTSSNAWKRMFKRADALFFILPATTRYDIRDRLGAKLGRSFSIAQIDYLLNWVRRHCDILGWTAHYAQFGQNPLGKDRFIVLLKQSDGTWHSDDETLSCNEGALSVVSTTSTLLSRLAEMNRMRATREQSVRVARKLRQRARDYDYTAQNLADYAQDLADAV